MKFDKMKYNYGQKESPLLIWPEVFYDKRGYLYEVFSAKDIENLLLYNKKIVCSKISVSDKKHTLRGLHYNPISYKIMHVVKGKTFHVVVDMREGSPRYLTYQPFDLNDSFPKILIVPPGFANGFLTLKNNTIVEYKLTEYYENYTETVIKWNDPRINIKWPFKDISECIISDKDK